MASLCAAQLARANVNQCLLGPVAVPALSGPPEWEDFNADGAWRAELHDPRWSGSPIQYLSALPVGGSGTWAQDVSMRAVTVGKIVYVSIQGQTDDNGPDANDFVYVAFSQGSAAGAYAVAINLASGGTVINPPPPPAAGVVVPHDTPLPTELQPTSVSWYHSTNAETDPAHPATEPTWDLAQDGIPTWLKGARWDRSALGSPRWAITLRIDLSSSGVNIGGPTRFFFGAAVHTTVGDVIVGNTTPKVGTDADKLDLTPIPKRSDLWAQYDEPGTACTGGITLDANDIGVWTGAPGAASGGSLTTELCTGSAACPITENTFRVTARHVPNGGGISPWDVRARVRIADWGSQYWEDAAWKDVATTPTGTAILLGPTAALTNGNGWYMGPIVDAGDGTSSVSMDYKCSKGADAFCPKVDTSELHQCVLAEIANPSGLWSITNTAAYQNMNYQTLSSHQREATISVAGLKKALGNDLDRDVYLYLDEHNLPKVGEKPFVLPSKDMERARRISEHPIILPTLPGKPGKPGKPPGRPIPGKPVPKPPLGGPNQPPATDKPVPAPLRGNPEELRRAEELIKSTDVFASGLPVHDTLAMTSEQVLDAVWPTYRVRVYVDSGKTFTAHGATNRVLVPMTPFGLRLQHAGSLYGFEHALSGLNGVVLTQINEHWFKLQMKSESSVKTLTKIAAVETLKPPPGPQPSPPPPGPQPPPQPKPPGCGCRVVQPGNGDLGWLAAALGLSVLTLARRRRNRS